MKALLVIVIVFYVAVVLKLSDGRKYDIEEECKKLYGEDLNKVLQRFRRTPDYIKILNMKKAETTKDFADMVALIYQYEEKTMKEKIYSIYNLTAPVDRRMFQKKLGSKKNKRGNLEKTPKADGKAKVKKRAESSEEVLSPVELLDNEVHGRMLTMAEANTFRDIGFEFAGSLFHKIIKNMDDDCSQKSTRLPNDDKYTFTHSTITEHVHEVTSVAHPESTHGVEGIIDGDETYFYRHRKRKLPNTELNG